MYLLWKCYTELVFIIILHFTTGIVAETPTSTNTIDGDEGSYHYSYNKFSSVVFFIVVCSILLVAITFCCNGIRVCWECLGDCYRYYLRRQLPRGRVQQIAPQPIGLQELVPQPRVPQRIQVQEHPEVFRAVNRMNIADNTTDARDREYRGRSI
ncbi:hypothetical protein DMN91_004566 [Ooceraea biroi]|uniref:Uncharacterized protein n=1 Tax=Ooceraea biroi TaxID=2015173 RepID=A0A3L8DR63_OOCBI|nr:hypothetical protein DMN91_004566 [Ooceraea biroi]